MREITIKLRKDLEEQILSKNPIIENRMLKSYKGKIAEGDIIKFESERGKFLARGYYGIQNKGCGWILSYAFKEKIDDKFFKRIINRAISARNNLHKDSNTNAYRIFNAEGDGIGGLSIDLYGQNVLIQWYSKGIYRFRNIIINIIKKRMPEFSVFEKRRFGESGKYIHGNDFVCGDYQNNPTVVCQHGIKYMVDLDDGAMTGLFLDQRKVRNKIKNSYAKDKNVLNLFSYTGAFGVAAKLGGANSTVNVDVAKRSLELTKRNYEINNLEFTDGDVFIGDVFEYIKFANKRNRKWDLIILDPPSFSRSKGSKFQVEKDYMDLVRETSRLLSEKGILVASTNYSKWSQEDFVKNISDAILSSHRSVNILETYGLPDDFKINSIYPESNYLKVVILELSSV